MGRKPLNPDGPMPPAERVRRYRQKHRTCINRTRRLRRLGIAQPATGQLSVRLTQLDGTLPNLALMKLAAFHRQRGDEVVLSRSPYRSPAERHYDRIYGSAIFSFSARRASGRVPRCSARRHLGSD